MLTSLICISDSDPNPPERFVPDWKITSDDLYNTSATCREMLSQFSTPAEQKFQRSFSHKNVLRSCFLKLGATVSTVADLLDRDEDLCVSYEELKKEHEKLKETYEGRKAQVLSLQQEKKDLEVKLDKRNKDVGLEESLKRCMNEKIKGQKEKIALLESEKERAVREFLPTVVSRLLKSEEYQKHHARVQSLSFSAGYIGALKMACSPEMYEELIASAIDLDLDAEKTFEPAFEELFDTTYSYVERVSASYSSSVTELLNIHPEYAEPEGAPET